MTKEEAEKAKGEAAAKSAKGYAETMKKYNVDPGKTAPPPELGK